MKRKMVSFSCLPVQKSNIEFDYNDIDPRVMLSNETEIEKVTIMSNNNVCQCNNMWNYMTWLKFIVTCNSN